MKKRMLSLLLVASLAVGMLAGCGEKEKESDTDKETSKEDENDSEEDKEDEGDSQAELSEWDQMVANIPDEIPDLSGYTISILGIPHWSSSFTYEEANEKGIYAQVAELTGVTFEWETVPADDYDSVLQTRLVGGEEPDIIRISNSYVPDYVDEGILYDFTQAYDVAPMMEKYYEVDVTSYKADYGYNGGIYMVPVERYGTSEGLGENYGLYHSLAYREDVLKDLGYEEAPTTIEGWREVLKEVKATYPDMIPYAITSYGYSGLYTLGFFAGSYGLEYSHATVSDYRLNEDGTFTFIQDTDAFEDFVEEMNLWYEEGLFGIITDPIADPQKGNVFAVEYDTREYLNYLEELRKADEDALFVAAAMPTADGYDRAFGAMRPYSAVGWAVVDKGDEEQCRAAVQLIEFMFFSEWGKASQLMGTMAMDQWYFDENGELVVNEEYVIALSQGTAETAAESGYEGWHRTPNDNVKPEAYKSIVDEYNVSQTDEEKQYILEKAEAALQENLENSVIPALVAYMPDDLREEYSTLTTDLETFISENFAGMVTGETAIDWDVFETCLYDDFKLERILELRQMAYEAGK